MALAGELVVQVRAEVQAFLRDMEKSRQAVNQTARAAESTTAGFKKIERASAELGLQMIGLRGHTARLADGLLLMGVGGMVTLGLTAGLAAIGFAYEKLTEKTRKAREELQKLIDAQVKAAQQKLDPFADSRAALAGLAAQAAEIRQQITAAQQQQTLSGFGAGKVGLTVAPDPQLALDLQKKLNDNLSQQAIIRAGLKASIDDTITGLKLEAQSLQDGGRGALVFGLALKNATAEQIKAALAAFDHLQALKRATEAGKEWAATLAAMRKELGAIAASAGKFQIELPKPVASRVEAIKDFQRQHRDQLTGLLGFDPTGQPNDMALFNRQMGGGTDVDAIRKAEKERATAWKETWKNAVRDTQQAFADFFATLFTQGNSLATFFRGVAQAINRAFADALAKQVVDWGLKVLHIAVPSASSSAAAGVEVAHQGGVVGSIGPSRLVDPAVFAHARRMHAGGLVGGEVPIIAQAGETVLPRGARVGGPTNVTLHQTVNLYSQSLDPRAGAQFLQSQAGTIVSITAKALQDVPGLGRLAVGRR